MRKTIFILVVAICCQTGFVACQSNKQNEHEKVAVNMHDTTEFKNKEAVNLAISLKRKGIKDEQVLAAIAKIPRHRFIDESLAEFAYEDRPLPIDKKQTISQPYTVAFQTELLEIKPKDKVLEIGTGSGYQAAVLCEMQADVYSIERHYQLHLKAKEVLSRLGYHPTLIYGDGYQGLKENSPFDKILVTASVKEFPEKLLEQLKIGGLMVAPIGDSKRQVMTVVKRLGIDEYKTTEHGAFIFVPMIEGVDK